MKRRKALTEAERKDLETFLKDRLEARSPFEARNALMILTSLYSGARAEELLALDWADINLKTGEVLVRTLKRRKRKPGESDAEAVRLAQASAEREARALVLPGFLLGPLRALKLRSSGPKLFPISYNRLGEIWREYRPASKPRPKPLHALRHSFAFWVYAKTKDIRFTQAALGHADIRNTMEYLNCNYDAQEYKKLMRIR